MLITLTDKKYYKNYELLFMKLGGYLMIDKFL